jgi:hypothetical protein
MQRGSIRRQRGAWYLELYETALDANGVPVKRRPVGGQIHEWDS